MAQPIVDVLGVYRLDVPEELFREQFDILYRYPMSPEDRVKAERECREQLLSAVLIETLVNDRDQSFRVGDFAQARDGQPKENWQVAWAEAFLTEDGARLEVERWSDEPQCNPLRVAFFIHFWDSARPLQTSYGEVTCPVPEQAPERLKRLVPYIPLD